MSARLTHALDVEAIGEEKVLVLPPLGAASAMSVADSGNRSDERIGVAKAPESAFLLERRRSALIGVLQMSWQPRRGFAHLNRALKSGPGISPQRRIRISSGRFRFKRLT